jgi:acetylornithine deacetylase/succinyl-diaminopimelate desuccinylase-like protein
MVFTAYIVAINEAPLSSLPLPKIFPSFSTGVKGSVSHKLRSPAVVWSTIDGTAHQPNEYVKITNLIDDTKVFGYLMSQL